MLNFKSGQKVLYQGKESHIEILHDNGTCVIANPQWNWDEEAECVEIGIEYDIPYWITVNLSELSAA
jgi:hypothetical protein